MVMKLKHSVYGLSLLPGLWYITTDAALLEIGFTPTPSASCVVVHTRKGWHIRHSYAIIRRYPYQWKQPCSCQAVGEGADGPLRHGGHGRI